MIAYFAGIATVFAIAYVLAGLSLVAQSVLHERPSQVRHNAPPDKWYYHNSVFVIAMLVAPVLWPLVITVFRLNSKWAIRRWNNMTTDERKAEIAAYREKRQ